MKKSKKENFIEQQIDNLKNEEAKSEVAIKEDKDKFASKVQQELETTNEESFNPDYFNDAFKKIDADRITTQIEMNKIDEEIEAEENARAEEEERQRKEKIAKKIEEKKIETTVEPKLETVEVKEDKKKISFFDKLLRVL